MSTQPTIPQPAPLNGAEVIQAQIAELQELLQKNAPQYEMLLRTIHVALSKDEALVHLLKEEEVGIIVNGLSKKKGVVIAAIESKSNSRKTSSGKSLKEVTAEDI